MNAKVISMLAGVVALAAACNSNDGKTVLTVKVSENLPSEVRVVAGDVDTTLTAENGVATVSLASDKTVVGNIVCGNMRAQFVPEGKAVTVDITSDTPALVAPAGSVNAKLQDYYTAYYKLNDELMARYQQFLSDSLTEQSAKEAAFQSYADSCSKVLDEEGKKLIAENKDNALALIALQQIYYDLSPEEAKATLTSLDPALQEDSFVKDALGAITSRESTAEGKMFTDFTVQEDEETSVKFSDYVGTGKYMLVDFWASWCGPCRQEVPNIKAVWEKYHGDKFDVLGVAVWDKPEDTKAAIEELQLPYSQIINAQKIPTDIYGIEGIPHIILFGPDGTILRRDLRGEQIEATVAEYLAK